MKTAFIFPGQGSQKVGMGKDLCENFKIAKDTFEEASDAISIDLSKLCFEGPEEDLKLTKNTQPAILTHSIAAAKVFHQETEILPQVVCGHSLGEYSALVWAKSLSLSDAVQTVAKRGELMQEAVPAGKGAMAAILRIDSDKVRELCHVVLETLSPEEVLEMANFNSPEQTVIAGTKNAIDIALTTIKENPNFKAKGTLLPVSAPFHCSMMKPAADGLKEHLEKIKISKNEIGYIPNISALFAKIETPVETIRQNLVDQVCGTVRWVETVSVLNQLEIEKCIELGPGNVLAGLIKRINKANSFSIDVLPVSDSNSLKAAQS